MTLEDIIISLQFFQSTRQRIMNINRNDMILLYKTDRDIVFLCFDIKQIIDRHHKIISPAARIVDCNNHLLLFLSRFVQQIFHSVS